ncbi:hypothetical protein B9T23_08110 [Acinetobacter terrae]|nr:hypothetical protein B9T23_08110 [Acinetobacter terrae]
MFFEVQKSNRIKLFKSRIDTSIMLNKNIKTALWKSINRRAKTSWLRQEKYHKANFIIKGNWNNASSDILIFKGMMII